MSDSVLAATVLEKANRLAVAATCLCATACPEDASLEREPRKIVDRRGLFAAPGVGVAMCGNAAYAR